jgi:hypothetical protein
MNLINREGQKYNRLTLISRITTTTKNKVYWICRCDCGTVKTIRWSHILSGAAKSCGCLRKTQRLTHGMSKVSSPEYISWVNMRGRCTNPNLEHAAHYVGRGITVCERWNNFENFYADMGSRPVGHSLDRIDVNGNYEPKNCRWASKIVQIRNMRPRKRIEQFSDDELLHEINRRSLL